MQVFWPRLPLPVCSLIVHAAATLKNSPQIRNWHKTNALWKRKNILLHLLKLHQYKSYIMGAEKKLVTMASRILLMVTSSAKTVAVSAKTVATSRARPMPPASATTTFCSFSLFLVCLLSLDVVLLLHKDLEKWVLHQDRLERDEAEKRKKQSS